MWQSEVQELEGGRARRIRILRDADPFRYEEVMRLWQEDPAFRSFFNSLLAEAPYQAFRWETPPVTRTTVSRPFEFVLLDSPGLAANPDPTPFAAQLGPGDEPVVTFANLGRDAFLVVPRRIGPTSPYGHLAAFVRGAPSNQQDALWRAVGLALEQQLSDRPVWLSTAGAGVSWLHVRFDSRPKYYGHRPYREGA